MNLKTKFSRIHLNHLHVGLVVILLILIAVVFIRGGYVPGLINPPVGTPQIFEEGEFDLLVINDTSLIEFPNMKVQLPESWTITGLLNSTSGTLLRCVTDGCKAAILSSTLNESSLTEVVFSTASTTKPILETPDLKAEDFAVEIAGQMTSLSAYRQTVYKISVNEQGEDTPLGEEISEILQIDGCDSRNLCVLASFSADAATNQKQLTEFKKLLSEIQVTLN